MNYFWCKGINSYGEATIIEVRAWGWVCYFSRYGKWEVGTCTIVGRV